MIQNMYKVFTRQNLSVFNQLSFIGKADYCKLQVLLFSQKYSTFLFIQKSWLFLKVLLMLFFLFHLMRRRQISWVDFARVIKAINQEKMMLRRCATAIAYCLDRSSFRMQTIYRVSNCPSNIQSRKKTKKFCGN